VFARLGVDGARLHGRYFYEQVGVDIALDGSVTPAGAVHLVEGNPRAPTGVFDGTCRPSGAIDGTWNDGSKSGLFALEPVPGGDVPVVATHHFSLRRSPKTIGPMGMKACTYSESWIELFGVHDAAAERAVNGQGLEVRRGPVLSPEQASDAQECEMGEDWGYGRSVKGSFAELVTILSGGGGVSDGAAHPTNFAGFSLRTYDLRTGKVVDKKAVFARDPAPLVLSCVLKSQATPDLTAEFWTPQFEEPAFNLTERGVHFFSEDYPHFAAAFTGAGPVVGYDVLLRDGYLRADSPVRRAWASVAPAPRAKEVCPSGDDAWQ
jgi:hypothetical protein